ncbi:hypothetical protein B0H13DRAFT_1855110 [Mycena leptocephala]|nr:hypothetical protein B0H13DRAFT_1855110 [Mycena leptocephala]
MVQSTVLFQFDTDLDFSATKKIGQRDFAAAVPLHAAAAISAAHVELTLGAAFWRFKPYVVHDVETNLVIRAAAVCGNQTHANILQRQSAALCNGKLALFSGSRAACSGSPAYVCRSWKRDTAAIPSHAVGGNEVSLNFTVQWLNLVDKEFYLGVRDAMPVKLLETIRKHDADTTTCKIIHHIRRAAVVFIPAAAKHSHPAAKYRCR